MLPVLTSLDCANHVHLVVGDNGIASKRAKLSLDAGASCFLISAKDINEIHFDVKDLIETGSVRHIQRDFEENDLRTLGRSEVDGVVDMVFVTLSPLDQRGTVFESGCT